MLWNIWDRLIIHTIYHLLEFTCDGTTYILPSLEWRRWAIRHYCCSFFPPVSLPEKCGIVVKSRRLKKDLQKITGQNARKGGSGRRTPMWQAPRTACSRLAELWLDRCVKGGDRGAEWSGRIWHCLPLCRLGLLSITASAPPLSSWTGRTRSFYLGKYFLLT